MEEFTVVCAYCKKVIKEGCDIVSHGICDDCEKKAMEELNEQ